MIKNKTLWSKILFILTTVYLMPAYVGAENEDFWNKMQEHANNKAAQEKAWVFVSGPMALFFQIIFIIGLAILLLAVAYISVNAAKGFLGKGGITKPVLKVFITGLIIGILCTSGGWIGIFKATQDLAVKPASDILTDQTQTNTGQTEQQDR